VSYLIDTNVAIHLRDGDIPIVRKLAELPMQPAISVVTRVELEGGVYRDPSEALLVRGRVDAMLEDFEEIPFTATEAIAYGRIVEQCGFSRPKIVDRMIAATAVVAGATLITLNPRDFRGIPELMIEDWSN